MINRTTIVVLFFAAPFQYAVARDAFMCNVNSEWKVIQPDDLKHVRKKTRCIAIKIETRPEAMMKCITADGAVVFTSKPDFVIERQCTALSIDGKAPVDR